MKKKNVESRLESYLFLFDRMIKLFPLFIYVGKLNQFSFGLFWRVDISLWFSTATTLRCIH